MNEEYKKLEKEVDKLMVEEMFMELRKKHPTLGKPIHIQNIIKRMEKII